RLGEAAKLAAASGVLSNSGWAKFPLTGGVTLIVQWGRWEGGVTSTTYNCDIAFPVAFPAACFGVYSSAGVRASNYDYVPSYRTLRQAVSVGYPTKTGANAQFFLDDTLPGNSRMFTWFAIGF
ncbi:gp53-like domain-containing protein, partial [Enterobacter hormaechei]